MAHSLNTRAAVDARGQVWIEVGVCLSCEPAETVRRTFDVDGHCPRCGRPGSTEWRASDLPAGVIRGMSRG